MLQQATPFSYPAPLEPRWMTRCNRPDVNCFYVSTVTDSPSKVPAIAAAPIWYDARLRSHSNGMTAAGRAGNVWGLLNSPHALAVRFHQYTFLFLPSHVYRRRPKFFNAQMVVLVRFSQILDSSENRRPRAGSNSPSGRE